MTQRFPTPDLPDDGMTMSVADWKLSPKAFAQKRAAVKAALEAFLPVRFVMVVGVTKKLQIASGDESGAMVPGRAYQVNRGDYIKMKLDPERSPFIMCLEPKVPSIFFEVSRAIGQLWPHQARNPFLSLA